MNNVFWYLQSLFLSLSLSLSSSYSDWLENEFSSLFNLVSVVICDQYEIETTRMGTTQSRRSRMERETMEIVIHEEVSTIVV
jgi:hypothetical protein